MIGGGFGIGMGIYLRDHFSASAMRINGQMLTMAGNARALAATIDASLTGLAMMGGAVFASGMLAARTLKGMVKVGMEFEKIMDAVGAVVDEGDVKMRVLRDTAMDLGKTTVFSAREIGKAMEELAKAGFGADQIKDSISGVTYLAGAADFGLLQSADILNNTMQVFGIATDNANHVADLLTYAANKSNVNLDDLGESLKYIGDTATDLGVPLEDTLALLMKLGNAGLKGSIAGVSGANWLRNLTKAVTPFATANQKKGMDMLGLSSADFIDGKGNLKPVTELVDILMDASKVLTTIEKQAAFMAIFDVRGKRGLAPLMRLSTVGQSMAGYAEGLKSADVQGMAKAVSDAKLDNLAGDVKKLNAAWEVLSITYEARIEPFLRSITGGLTSIVNSLNYLMDSPLGGFIAAAVSALTLWAIAWGGIRLVVGLFGKMFLTSTATFRSMSMTLSLVLNRVSSQLAGIGVGMMGMGRGIAGAGMMGAGAMAGVAMNRNGLPYVMAGQTVNHAGRTYRGGQLLPAAALGAGVTRAGLQGGAAAGAASVGLMRRIGPMLSRLGGFVFSLPGMMAILGGSYLISHMKAKKAVDEFGNSISEAQQDTDSFATRVGKLLGYKQEGNKIVRRDTEYNGAAYDAYRADMQKAMDARYGSQFVADREKADSIRASKRVSNYIIIDGKLVLKQEISEDTEDSLETELGY